MSVAGRSSHVNHMRSMWDVDGVLEGGTWAETQLPRQLHTGSMRCEAERRRGVARVPGQWQVALEPPTEEPTSFVMHSEPAADFIKGTMLKI